MTTVSPTPPVELAIGGMTCAACAARVERKLNKLDGVSASVNFATERAVVHATTALPAQRLVEEVTRAGYTAEVLTTGPAARRDDEVRRLWRRLVVALLAGVPAADLSFTLTLVPSLRFPGWQLVVLALALPVVTWCAWPFHHKAAAALRQATTSMDTLVSAGIVASTLWSGWAMITHPASTAAEGGWGLLLRPSGSLYLDVAVGVTVFVLAGRLYEAKAKRAAGNALRALGELRARDVRVLDDDGHEHTVPAARLSVGDRFVVRPGEAIATDGVVEDGMCAVDGSAMTGEPVPREVAAGDTVLGATIAVGGRIVVRATAVGAQSRLGALTRLVERAQHDKAAAQRLADRVSAFFVPAVLVLAAATFIGWLVAGGTAEPAFAAGLAVLIIACPCALGLATPMALLVASGRGAQLGVFLKGQQAIETARAIDTVVLDKTGTVTTGRIVVTEVRTAGTDRDTLIRLAAAVEKASEHLIAAAVVAEAEAASLDVPAVTGFRPLAGLGATGTVEGHEVIVGSLRLLADSGVILAEPLSEAARGWEAAGLGVVGVAQDGAAIGVLAVSDSLRTGAASAVAALHELGLRTVLLTGDREATAHAVAEPLGVRTVIAEVLPDEKAAQIARLRAAGRTVAMVGDGINDAPALAGADLGIALVTGTDVAADAADVLLAGTDLTVLPRAIRLARATLRTIRGNLWWAFGYNVAAIPIAAAGLLNPVISAAAMAVSSLFVVSNSLRLRSFDAAAGQAGDDR